HSWMNFSTTLSWPFIWTILSLVAQYLLLHLCESNQHHWVRLILEMEPTVSLPLPVLMCRVQLLKLLEAFCSFQASPDPWIYGLFSIRVYPMPFHINWRLVKMETPWQQ